MKKFLTVFVLLLLSSVFAVADTPHATLVPVRRTHQRVQRHKAHKAGKHHTPKRHRHSV